MEIQDSHRVSGQNRCPAGRLPPPPFPFSTNIAFLYSWGSYFLSLFRFGTSLILGKLWELDLPTSGFWWFVSILWILEDWIKEMLWGCQWLAFNLTIESTTQGTLQTLQVKHLCFGGAVLIISWLTPSRE